MKNILFAILCILVAVSCEKDVIEEMICPEGNFLATHEYKLGGSGAIRLLTNIHVNHDSLEIGDQVRRRFPDGTISVVGIVIEVNHYPEGKIVCSIPDPNKYGVFDEDKHD